MTISSTVRRSGPYNGNGSATTFAYGFKVFESTGLQVIKTIGGVDAIVSPSDYSVTGVGASGGGNIVFTVAPATGSKITIIGNEPFTQTLDLENQGAYFAEDIEKAFDRAAMRDQQLEERLDRAVTIPVGTDPSELDGMVANIIRLYESADNIDTVADNIDAVNDVAPHAATIAANVADITNFADVYQGPKALDPALRNDGSPLQKGDLYFNTSVDMMKVYVGSEWADASSVSLNIATKAFSGDGSTVAFSLNVSPGVAANVLVFVGGVLQYPLTDYTVSGSTLTFLTAPANGVDINTWVIATVSTLNIPADGSVSSAKIADGSVTSAKIADGTLRASEFPAANDVLYLPAIRRRLRSVPDIGDYGIFSSGVTNYGQSDFNTMISGLKADGYRGVLVPAGNYRLGEQISIADGVMFEGESQSASVFKFYHANSAFVFTGANENGGGLKGLSIVNDLNALATAYVQLIASVDGTSPDFFKIEDVNMTCFNSGTIQYGVIANGNARNGSAPNGLHGIRNLKVSGVDIFNCTVANMDLRNARSPKLHNLAHYQAGGTLTKLIVGGTDATRASSNLQITGSTLGDVAINFASKVIAAGCDISAVTLAAGSSSCRLSTVFGAVSNAGTGNSWTT